MAEVGLNIASERITAASNAGELYTSDLEEIRDTLDDDSSSGTTLGAMVGAQLSLTETETVYQVASGIPNKVSKSVAAAAAAVKSATN